MRRHGSLFLTVSLIAFCFVVAAGCQRREGAPVSASGGVENSVTASDRIENPSKQDSLTAGRGGPDSEVGGRKHALLVGCSDYPNLAERFQLQGPVNDVRLIQKLLIDRFDYDPKRDSITVLAASEDTRHQPTRANIEREFRHLAEEVGPDEQVVILLGGHGSQQPNNDPESDPEPDGLDEVFLPCDAGAWDGDAGTVANAIVDDDFKEWLSAIVAKQAFVWLVMDACHSGSGVRGGDVEISRNVPPETLVPREVLDSVTSTSVSGNSTDSLFDGPGGLVATYAAQPHETTPERKLPRSVDPESRRYYGLLTYTLGEILQNTPRSLTYKELVQAVQSRYVSMGRRAPTPLLEGSHRDNVVLGRETFPERSRFLLERRNGSASLSVSAGALHGLTYGSILAVYPPIESSRFDANKSLGNVRVTRVEMTEVDVEPCEFDGMATPPTNELLDRSRCEVVYRDLGEHRLRVAVDRLDIDGKPLPEETYQNIVNALMSIESPLVAINAESEEADWLVRSGAMQIELVPTAGIASEIQLGHEAAFAPRSLSDDWAEETLKDLEKIARAKNLLRLGELASERSRGGANLGLVIRVVDAEGEDLPWGSSGRKLRDGEQAVVMLDNSANKQGVDVTLLYVDSEFGIDCLYPDIKKGESNRLAAGEQQQFELNINADTIGLEHLVSIVVKADGQTVDYGFLEQPSLERGRQRGADEAFDTPLGRLCKTSLYGQGTTRGVSRKETANYDIGIFSWRIEP